MKIITLLMMMLPAGSDTAATPDVQLLDFTASYCEPCQRMIPILQKMERDRFPIRRIDITEEHELSRRFEVELLPTLVLLVEGKEVKRFVGLTDEAELRNEMNRAARRLSESRQASIPASAPKQTQPAQDAAPVKTADARLPADARPSIKEIFRNIFGGETKHSPFEYPRFRGQSPETTPELIQGLQAAAAATVRIHVSGTTTKDGKKIRDVGTGTIIYSAAGQAIILTCAHVFLDIAMNDAAIEVEVFEKGNVNPYRATLVSGDHNSDLALLRIQTTKILPFVRLTQLAPVTEKGQSLVSFGCNEGANPTQLDTRLVEINRYEGPEHFVCTTDPKSGRSGGGLFNTSGDLLGVCSCADRPSKEGLYMAHAAILKFVAEQKLQSILLESPKSGGEDAAASFADLLEGKSSIEKIHASPAADTASSERIVKLEPPAFDESVAAAGLNSGTTRDAGPDNLEPADSMSLLSESDNSVAPSSAARTEHSGPEVTIMIDDKTPGSQPRTIVIPQASPWMMELLTGESGDGAPSSTNVALRPHVSTVSARTPARLSRRSTVTSH